MRGRGGKRKEKKVRRAGDKAKDVNKKKNKPKKMNTKSDPSLLAARVARDERERDTDIQRERERAVKPVMEG